jgi:hypothetical protein
MSETPAEREARLALWLEDDWRAYVERALRRAVDGASMNTGRDVALFKAALGLSNLVAARFLHSDTVTAALLNVARQNGLMDDKGERALKGNIARALKLGDAAKGRERRAVFEAKKRERWGLSSTSSSWSASSAQATTSSPPPPDPEAEAKAAAKAEKERELIAWADAQAVPIPGSLGEVYTQVRGILPPENLRAWRYLERGPFLIRDNLTVWTRERLMVAFATTTGGEITCIELTPLIVDGTDRVRSSKPPRGKIGAMTGAAIRLADLRSDNSDPWAEALALAEGVEDALAYWRLTGCPTWALLGAGNFAAFAEHVPSLATEVRIAADHDHGGMKGARDLRERLLGLGDVDLVEVDRPRRPAKDWGDVAAKLWGARDAA